VISRFAKDHRRYDAGMAGRLIRRFEPGEFNELFRDALPPTSDDVSITKDGRRLDTAEKVIEFFAELEAERAAEADAGAPTPTSK
jgi:hypothetical protein